MPDILTTRRRKLISPRRARLMANHQSAGIRYFSLFLHLLWGLQPVRITTANRTAASAVRAQAAYALLSLLLTMQA